MIKENISWGKRVPKSDVNKFGYIHKSLDEINLDKPLLLVIGGKGTATDADANGYAKTINSLLGIKSNDEFLDIYSVAYSDIEKKDILNDYILKMKNLLKDEKGFYISKDKAIKKMRNLNIFSHCYGAYIVDLFFKGLYTDLLESNAYNINDLNEIMGQVYQVSYAPYKESSYANIIYSVYVKDMQDEIIGFNQEDVFNIYDKEVNLRNKVNVYDDSLFYSKFKENSIYFFTNHVLFNSNNGDWFTHSVKFLSKVIKNDDIKNKYTFDFINSRSFRSNVISDLLGLALSYGVVNSLNNFENFNNFEELYDVKTLNKFLVDDLIRNENNSKNLKFKKVYKTYTDKLFSNLINVKDFLKDEGIREFDLINGNINLSNLEPSDFFFQDNINYNNTHYCPLYLQELYPLKFISKLMILENGKIIYDGNHDLRARAIQARINGYKLENSLKLEKVYNKIKGKHEFIVSPNYGFNDGNKHFKNLDDLLDNWHKNYDNLKASKKINLSLEQCNSLLYLLDSKNISKNDLKFDNMIDCDNFNKLYESEKEFNR